MSFQPDLCILLCFLPVGYTKIIQSVMFSMFYLMLDMGHFYRTSVHHCWIRSYFHSSLRLCRQFSAIFEVAHVLAPGRHCCCTAATGAWRSEVSRQWYTGSPHQVLHICWYSTKWSTVGWMRQHVIQNTWWPLWWAVLGSVQACCGEAIFQTFFWWDSLYEEGEHSEFLMFQYRARILDFYSNINEFTKGYRSVT